MNKQMLDIFKDALIMTLVACGLAVSCNYTFSKIKGAGVKNDPLVTAVTQSSKDDINAILSDKGFQADNHGAATLVDYRVIRTNKGDNFGRTPLMWAAYVNFYDRKPIDIADAKRVETAALLLDAGTNINGRDNDQWTALMWASWSGLTKTADLLVNRGADINLVDKNGQTALMFAVMRGNTDVVKLLLAKGADKNVTAKNGKRAIDYLNDATAQYSDRADEYAKIKPLL